jgi:hypothetical protein
MRLPRPYIDNVVSLPIYKSLRNGINLQILRSASQQNIDNMKELPNIKVIESGLVNIQDNHYEGPLSGPLSCV